MAVTASSWPMTRCLQLAFHREQFLRFLLLHPLERNAGPFEMMCIMSSAVTSTSFSSRSSRHSARIAVELLLRLLFLVAQGGRFLEILRLDRSFLFHANLFDLALRSPSRPAAASSR